MKQNFLNELVLNILAVSPNGISKVKLAKIFYLTHKWLVKCNLANSNDWAYIRMPLGPVPVDFKSLVHNELIKINIEATLLSYNTEVYSLISQIPDGIRNFGADKVVNKLNKFSTSALVEYTHKEPSWMKYENGKEYLISDEDLRRQMPSSVVAIDALEDNQHLQSHLIEGMIEDIVDVSTALEYPKDTEKK